MARIPYECRGLKCIINGRLSDRLMIYDNFSNLKLFSLEKTNILQYFEFSSSSLLQCARSNIIVTAEL